MLYPQNGGRIVTIDSVTSLHPMYCIMNVGALHFYSQCTVSGSLYDPLNVQETKQRVFSSALVSKGVRRILIRGSMPPCRLRRRKF